MIAQLVWTFALETILLFSTNPWTAEREPGLLETSLPGVFVAGDARRSSMKRVASAVGEGAIAVHLVHQYLDKM